MDQYIVLVVLAVQLLLFIWGTLRYDLVALLGLFFLASIEIVPPEMLFSGFSHPAVTTVIAVMLIGSGLQEVGLIERCAIWLHKVGSNFYLQLLSLCLPTMILSSFMNNVGALAVFMPLALEMAKNSQRSPSLYLMPLSFSSLLGGMTTMIGTPPNIVIASYRHKAMGESFSMFDFTPVGASIAIVGLIWVVLIGWRFLPQRQKPKDLFDVKKYLSEVRIIAGSKLIDKNLEEIEQLSERQIQVVGLKRGQKWQKTPSPHERLCADDFLLIEVDSTWLEKWVKLGLVEIVGDFEFEHSDLKGEELQLSEVVIMPGSSMIGRLAHQLRLRYRFGVNLLAVGRREERYRGNLRSLRFASGDILLLRAPSSLFQEAVTQLGCLPLATQEWQLRQSKQLYPALGAFVLTLLVSGFGLLPPSLSLSLCAFSFILTGWLPLKKLYEVIPWPVVTLLAAMIPMGQALEATDGAAWIASKALYLGENLSPRLLITCTLLCTMLLSDVINNAAAAILFAPIATKIASMLALSAEPFLMSVAIGASSSFLTPIGHQCNTLVMSPGGYRFGDYWRLGLPVDVIILIIAPLLILKFWPLTAANPVAI